MSFSRTVTLPVPPDEAFALVTEPERLRRWKTVSAYVDLRAGGEYRWTITPGHVAAGTFREIEPGRRVVYGWGWEGRDDLPPDASTVTVTIEPDPAGSRVTLEHDGLSELQATMHAEGWNHYLERLVRLATSGDAGPDEWDLVPDPLTAITAAEAALAALQPVLRHLGPDAASHPTPCADFTCEQLVEHLSDSLVQLGAMAGATVTTPQDGSTEDRISTMAAQAIDGWRSVALDGTVPGPGGREMPASFAASILPIELVLHAWDIAQSSGRPLRVGDEVVDYVRGLAESVVPPGRSRGAFGEEVAPPEDATPLDRFAAFAGRTPVGT
jgi:uncharacterized protein (TIGR03086 family)